MKLSLSMNIMSHKCVSVIGSLVPCSIKLGSCEPSCFRLIWTGYEGSAMVEEVISMEGYIIVAFLLAPSEVILQQWGQSDGEAASGFFL